MDGLIASRPSLVSSRFFLTTHIPTPKLHDFILLTLYYTPHTAQISKDSRGSLFRHNITHTMNVTDSFLDHRFTGACNEVLELHDNDRLDECVKKARELIKAMALQDTTA
jgi:hypothetical protein